MTSVLPHSLKLPATSCALLLPVLFVAAACGSEAPLPVIDNMGGAQTTGGMSVLPAGGMSGSVSASGSSTQPTGGTGTGGSSAGGMATGGVSTAGTATGGTGTSGSSAGGSGGASGSGPQAGTGGGGADIKETVAGKLNGAMMLGACLNDTAKSVCSTSSNGCPPENQADFALSGAITTDKTIALGGDPTKTYTITLHVQGEVESKTYDGAQDQSTQGASPKADGFAVGGTPTHQDYYNVYMVRVSTPKQDYFLNSLNPPGTSNHTTYGIDYTAKIKANGGAMLRLVAADRNCAMIKNCGPMVNDGSVCAAPIVLQNIDPTATQKNPTFNFQQAYNGQWLVMVVTDVTEG